MNNEHKFYSLTPAVLDKNSEIYDDAIDEALNNNEIRNIAITGIYGAGKSTVWKTYQEKNKLKEVINVSLGKYETKRESNQSIESFENNIERQLINQITAQVSENSISLSKYKFKRNKQSWKVSLETALAVLFILATIFSLNYQLFLIYFQVETKVDWFIGSIIVAMLIPLTYTLWQTFKNSKPFFSRIKVGNTEANFEEEINSDETVLDRDIRELVYILNNSKTKIVVFEDLDRYDHIDLYRKLRELNFLVNSYKRVNSSGVEAIKFIYLVKDGLFNSKERTKFFDFIIPIVPVINSRNSEYKLLELLEDKKNKPNEDLLFKISLYINDFRLLKNIVNEYTVYFDILPMDRLNLSKNKLFAMIVIKNIFPHEFDELQQDRGYIYNLLKKIEDVRFLLRNDLRNKINGEENRIKTLQEVSNIDQDELLANSIPAHVSILDSSDTWKDIIRKWKEKPEERRLITVNRYSNQSMTYSEFLKQISYPSNSQQEQLNLINENTEEKITEIRNNINKIFSEIDEVAVLELGKILRKLNTKNRNEYFETSEDEVVDDQIKSFTKFLVLEGYLDETYWYYKGYMNVDMRGVSDTLFLKNILEGNEQEIYLEIENPNKVVNQLSLDDFNRFNILNEVLLVYLVKNNLKDEIFQICESISRFNTYDDIISILSHCYKEKDDKIFVNSFLEIIYPKFEDMVYLLIKKIKNFDAVLFGSIIGFLYNNFSLNKGMNKFNDLVLDSPGILNMIDKDDESKLLNLKSLDLEFDNLPAHDLSEESVLLIYDYDMYTTNIDNLHYIVNSISKSIVDYSKLLEYIFDINSQFKKMKEKVSLQDFLPLYVNRRKETSKFLNNENLTIDVINSSIDIDYKLEYLSFNETKLTDIIEIKDIEMIIEDQIFEPIFKKNTLEFTTENIEIYIDNGGTISDNFIGYLETNIRNIEFSNIKDNPIYNNVFLSNQLINDPKISDTLFSTALNSAEKKIIELNPNIKEEFVIRLAESELLILNKYNIKLLLENSFLRSLTVLFNQPEGTIVGIFNQEPELLSELNEELIYELIQNVKNQENLLNLLTNIEFDFELSKINIKKDLIIEYVLSNQLTSENFKYVISNYDSFIYKDEFINNLNGTVHIENMDIRPEMVGFFKDYLSSNSIAIEDKAVLINRIIDLSSQPKDFIKYLEWVPEFRSLSTVFHGKHPSIESKARKIIVDKLANIGYITIRKDDRIMNKQKEI